MVSIASDRGLIGGPDAVEVREPVLPVVSDRVRWAPVIAGLVCCIASLVFWGVLGAALGLTVYEIVGPQNINPTLARVVAGIWGVVSALISFFFGGYVAASTASFRGIRFGFFHGALVWAASIALILIGLGGGISVLLGGASTHMFNTNRPDMAGVDARLMAPNVNPADRATLMTAEMRRDALAAAWTTLISLVLGACAAGLGGYLGSRQGLLEVQEGTLVHKRRTTTTAT